ncbi:MAG: S-layer homology domain-containing protein [Peptoniphilaceae bacterium]
MFKVTVVRDENSIKENVLYGKVYAVDKNNKLEQEKFPVLEAMDDYKDAKWNDGKKDVTDPSQEVINKDTIFTASAVSTLFDKDNVTGLEITTPPTKEDYKVGENFDPTGMVITLTDKNGNTQEVTPDKLGEYGITLEPKDNLQLGTDKITVKKGDNLSDATPITVVKGNSEKDVISFVPADPTNPANPEDTNIPTNDSDGNPIDKNDYILIGFKTENVDKGLLTLGEKADQGAISLLVKKDLTWEKVTAPTPVGKDGNEFWKWTPVLPTSTETVVNKSVYTANFIKTGDEVNPEDNLPNGWFKVSVEKGTGIKKNNLFGKTYAVKGGKVLEAGKFPQLQVSTNYKDAKWNDGEKDVEDPSQEVINKDTTFTASAVSTLFDKDNVTELKITTPPTKNDYKVGENFDPTGMVITLTDKNGNTQEVTPDKLGEYGITLEPKDDLQLGTNEITVKKGDLSDTTPITVKDAPVDAPVAPKVDTIKEGAKDIKVTVPEDGDKIEITLPDDTKVVVEKGEDGTWKTEDGKTVVEEDGKLVIPVDPSKVVQGGEGVIVTVTDSKTNKTSDPAKVEVTAVDEPIDNKSTKPNVDTIEVGDTEITGTGTPGATVTVTNPDGTTKDVTVNPDGTWTVTIDKAEAGDSYDITQTEEGKTPSEKETQVVLTSEQSTKPNVNPVKVGDTEITGTGTPGATVTVTNPDGTTKDVTVNPDGTWTVTIDKVEAGDSYEVTQTEEGKKASGEVTVRIKNSDNDNDSNVIWTGTVLGLGTGNFESEEVEKDFEIDIAYIHGYPNGEVRPDGNITRAEAAAMFARILKLDQSNSSNPNFADTDNVNAWYNASINAVVAKGLMKGYPDGNFKPNAPITRAEFAQLIKTIDKANSGNAPFEDIKGHWAKEAIDQAYANDRIAGYPDGSFRPDKSITRAEAAKIINSLFDRMVRAKGLLSIESGTIKHYTDIDVSHWGYYEIVEASNTHMFERIYKGAIEEEWSRVIDSYIQP